jgi:Ca-activated chloride channel family protein
MKHNKRLLFLVCGFLGGSCGALFAVLAPVFGEDFLGLALHVAVWSGMAASFMTGGLFAAGEVYHRKPFCFAVYHKGLVTGLLAGGLAGFVAQSVYSFSDHSNFFGAVVVRSLCWGLMGAILGWRLSSVIPNLGTGRGVLAGALGGFFGGVSFLLMCLLLPELMGRVIGLGILGAALGLAVVAIEEAFRSAFLEIIWAPKEVTTVTLGSKPVYLGGGDDHIFVKGLPQHALSVVLKDGQIHCTNHTNSSQSVLKEGSRIKVGKIEVVVRAKTTANV